MDAGRPAALITVLQHDGFFESSLNGGLSGPDCNGFATAQVLRALGSTARKVLGARSHEAALDALADCRNPVTGGFRFWPMGRRPAWAPDLPDDADDTALMAVMLWRSGRISLDDLRRTACRTVVSHRLAATVQPGPSWPRPGTFKTWMRPGIGPDMADCTVNANVIALLAAAGLRSVPGYDEACAMIEDAVLWAGDNGSRAETLSPFYPEAGELVLAVEAAIADGAHELRAVLALMDASPLWRGFRSRSCGAEPVICGSAYGVVRWSSRAVGMARRIGGVSTA